MQTRFKVRLIVKPVNRCIPRCSVMHPKKYEVKIMFCASVCPLTNRRGKQLLRALRSQGAPSDIRETYLANKPVCICVMESVKCSLNTQNDFRLKMYYCLNVRWFPPPSPSGSRRTFKHFNNKINTKEKRQPLADDCHT